MAKGKRLSDREVKAICEAEIHAASGGSQSELSEARSDAMERYLGEPYGNEVEGRSSIRTREVLDVGEPTIGVAQAGVIVAGSVVEVLNIGRAVLAEGMTGIEIVLR